MNHIYRLFTSDRLCELPAGTDLLDVGFVKTSSFEEGLPCVACAIVLEQANRTLDDK